MARRLQAPRAHACFASAALSAALRAGTHSGGAPLAAVARAAADAVDDLQTAL